METTRLEWVDSVCEGCVQSVITEVVIKGELVIIPDLDGKPWWHLRLSFVQAPEVLLGTVGRRPILGHIHSKNNELEMLTCSVEKPFWERVAYSHVSLLLPTFLSKVQSCSAGR